METTWPLLAQAVMKHSTLEGIKKIPSASPKLYGLRERSLGSHAFEGHLFVFETVLKPSENDGTRVEIQNTVIQKRPMVGGQAPETCVRVPYPLTPPPNGQARIKYRSRGKCSLAQWSIDMA